MKIALAIAASLISSGALAAPVNNAKAAIKVGCTSIREHLPGDSSACDDLVAGLKGDVWTVSHKQMPSNLIGGGAPVVEVSQETGEVLNFYLTD
jgi:hypothetical protein